MCNELFARITCDYYTRHYELSPEFTDGLQVTVYAECYPNIERMNDHYYCLDIYLSVGQIPIRDFVIGVSFGDGQLDKCDIDMEVDNWVRQIVANDTFPKQIEDYMKEQNLLEDSRINEILNDTDN